jgi:hypothetical protein
MCVLNLILKIVFLIISSLHRETGALYPRVCVGFLCLTTSAPKNRFQLNVTYLTALDVTQLHFCHYQYDHISCVDCGDESKLS